MYIEVDVQSHRPGTAIRACFVYEVEAELPANLIKDFRPDLKDFEIKLLYEIPCNLRMTQVLTN